MVVDKPDIWLSGKDEHILDLPIKRLITQYTTTLLQRAAYLNTDASLGLVEETVTKHRQQ